ncbi:hypothetical protein [Neisseria shayeganii]|uniref:LysR family transcriptional regulator n=1 Tax=Neisseria shayeganii 871 TaxID=1032488 RepID=G4CKD1_9NEIS|nr:hypothetical protein [Neisseria shayeganii]EGY51722.1 LysR family transcriptional regulator [Neisseria shayeganii 871]
MRGQSPQHLQTGYLKASGSLFTIEPDHRTLPDYGAIHTHQSHPAKQNSATLAICKRL